MPAQEHLRAVGKGAGITVGIANRQHGHARGARGGEGAAVADALARCDRADVNDPGIPRQHGLEPERTRTRGAVAHAEGEHAGTHHLAAVLRVHEQAARAGAVAHAGVDAQRLQTAAYLLKGRELRVRGIRRVGAGEVGVYASHVQTIERADLRGIRNGLRAVPRPGVEPEPVHAGVHLDVHIDLQIQRLQERLHMAGIWE